MGEMLSFHYGKSQGFQWVRNANDPDQVPELADENYAREIMQLFTIGTIKLNLDGTPQKDDQGFEISTHGTDDVIEMARAWTGLRAAKRRGNSVAQNGNR